MSAPRSARLSRRCYAGLSNGGREPAWYDDYVLTVGSDERPRRTVGIHHAGAWVDVAAPGEGGITELNGDGLANTVMDNRIRSAVGTVTPRRWSLA